jgi:hypothetical protein
MPQEPSCQVRVTGSLESGLTDYPDYQVNLVITVPLRDIFAGLALAGLVGRGAYQPHMKAVQEAYELTDKAMDARRKGTPDALPRR